MGKSGKPKGHIYVIEHDKRNNYNYEVLNGCGKCKSSINPKEENAIFCRKCNKWYHFLYECCGLAICNLNPGPMRKELRRLKSATQEDTNAYLCSDCKGDTSSVVTIQDDSGNIPDEEITSQLMDQTSDDNNGEGTSDQIELNTGNSSGENIGSSSGEEDTTVNSLNEVFNCKLTDKEKLIVRYLVGIIKKDYTTGPVTLETLTYVADTKNNHVTRTMIQNLCRKYVIERNSVNSVKLGKSGNGGFSIYKFSSENSYVKNIVEKLSESEDNYEYRDEVATLTGQKRKIVCYLVSISKNTTTGPISTEVLARVVGTSKIAVNNSVIQKLISKEGAYFIKINDQEPKKDGYKNFILNQNLIDYVKIIFPFYCTIKDISIE